MSKRFNFINNYYFLFSVLISGIIIRYLLFPLHGTQDTLLYSGQLKVILETGSIKYIYSPWMLEFYDWPSKEASERFIPALYPPGYAISHWLTIEILQILNLINNQSDLRIITKVPVIFFEFLIIISIYIFSSRKLGTVNTNFLFILYWLSPTFILAYSALGYRDTIFIFFLLCSIFLFINEKVLLGFIFFLISSYTKQLALVISPLILVLLIKENFFKDKKNYLAIIALGLAFVLPFLDFYSDLSLLFYENLKNIYGIVQNMYWSLFQDFLSANQFNVWWIYTIILEILNKLSDNNFFSIIFNLDARYLRVGSTYSFEHSIGKFLIISLTLVNAYLLYKNPRKNNFLYSIFIQYYAYIILATNVHENHNLVLCSLGNLILLLINHKYKIRYIIIINSMCFLSMFMFYGYNGVSLLRQYEWFGIATLLLSILNVYFFIKIYIDFLMENIKYLKKQRNYRL